MKRLLYGVITILIVVISVEIMYLFMNNLSLTEANTEVLSPSPSIVTPTIAVSITNTALDQDTIKRIQFTRSTGHIESILTQRFTGKIYKLSTSQYDLGNGLEKVDLITLTDKNITDENLMNIFVISKKQKDILDLTQREGGITTSINYKDLQVGDSVTIEVSMDMTKPITDNVTVYKITKII